MNFGQTRARLVQAGAALAAAALVAGCGNNYRPVITPINTPGPAPEVTSLAVAVSVPPASPTGVASHGVATIIDYSGDAVMNTEAIGVDPIAFSVDSYGGNGYTINGDGTMTSFPVSTSFLIKNENSITVPSTAALTGLFTPASGMWASDLTGNVADIFTGSPLNYKLSVPLGTLALPAPTATMVIGSGNGGQRYYALSQGSVVSGTACNDSPSTQPDGAVTGIEVATYTPDTPIQVGQCPVYGVMSSDGRRLFVLNRGSDTVSVINTENDTLDACTPYQNLAGQMVYCHPTLPLSTAALSATGITPPNCDLTADPTCGGMTATAGPVYAEYNAATSQLVVANYDGGTVSIIDVSEDEYGNDSPTFGTTYTVKVGNTSTPEPASVTVLVDGSLAYTANQGDGTTDGTVSIVNLSSHTLEKTLPVIGHPRTVVSTQNATFGKVYTASPDSTYLTIIRTDLDVVDTSVLVQGNVLDVRVTTQNGISGNNNNVSRKPGYGQPCNLPPSLEPAPAGTQTELQVCQQMPN